MRPFVIDVPLLENRGSGSRGGAPDFPYLCTKRMKSFHQLSQPMRHEGHKHSNDMGLIQYQ
jgi:hypothetical protein